MCVVVKLIWHGPATPAMAPVHAAVKLAGDGLIALPPVSTSVLLVAEALPPCEPTRLPVTVVVNVLGANAPVNPVGAA